MIIRVWYRFFLQAFLSIIIFSFAGKNYRLYAQSDFLSLKSKDYLLEVQRWDQRYGLPSWLVNDFIQDHRGLIWMTSNNGLIRFDGNDFVLYDPATSNFRTKNLAGLIEDVNGKIWTFFKKEDRLQADVFDPFLEKALPLQEYLGRSIVFPNSSYYGIFSNDQNIFVRIAENQLARYNGDWDTLPAPKVEYSKPSMPYPAPNGKIWTWLNDKGVYLSDTLGNLQAVYPKNDENAMALFIDEKGWFWLSGLGADGEEKLYCYTRDGLAVLPFDEVPPASPQHVTNMVASPELKLNQYGISVFARDTITKVFSKGKELFPGFQQQIQAHFRTRVDPPFYLTRDGAFWFISPEGLFRLQFEKNNFSNILTDGKVNKSMRGIISLEEDLMLTQSYQGTWIFNPKTGFLQRLSFPGDDTGLGLMKENDLLWLGNHFKHVIRYDLNKQDYEAIPVDFGLEHYDGYAFHRLTNGKLLMGTLRGIFQLEKGDQLFRRLSLQDTAVYCWKETESGLWAGTDEGLALFGEEGELIQMVPLLEDDPPTVFHIYQDDSGLFWLATNMGLLKWDQKTREVSRFLVSEGRSDATVHAVYEDDNGYLWLPSNYGLIRFRKSDGQMESFFTKDGLPHNEFNSFSHFQSESGRLFFGGLNGITSLHPDSIFLIKPDELSIRLLKACTFERHSEKESNRLKETINEGGLRIHPWENRIEFTFTAVYYGLIDVQFEWRLLPEDESWQSMNGVSLQLNNLSYGRHTLEVRAYPVGFSQDAVYLELPLLVSKPYFRQTWFMALMTLFLIFMIWQITRFRDRYLHKRNETLQKEVTRQTQEIIKDREIIARQARELKELDDAKSRFFANVSHELRTPLTLILGPTAELLKEEEIHGRYRKKLLRIYENTRELRRMTEEILDLTRLEAGKLELKEEIVAFPAFITRVFQAFSALADHKGIRYELKMELPEKLWLRFDPPKVERIVNNLISNALKFTPDGGRVTVFVHQLSDDIRVVVEDTGMGIAKEDLPWIFERYYQSKRQGAAGGMGLGLALSNEYAKLMGGSLQAESILEEGTRMCFRFPGHFGSFPENRHATNAEKKIIEPAGEQERISSDIVWHEIKNKFHLLIVEDHPQMMEYMVDLLQPLYYIDCARNGREALDILTYKKIDLVISDGMMPEMDGFQLIETLRFEQNRPNVPFLMVTARAAKEDRLNALQLGVDAYLSKPFEPEELLARVRNLLANHALRQKALLQMEREKERRNSFSGFATEEVSSFSSEWMKELEKLIREEISNSRLKVGDIAHRLAVSERTLRDRIKEYTGLSPNQYITEARLQKALMLLENKTYPSVAQVCYAVGLKTPSYFSKIFTERFGKSPSDFL